MKVLLSSKDVTDTRAVGEALAGSLSPDGALLLSGDLGSGKTVLTQGLAVGLGIEPAEVQSPTFTLIREHQGTRGDLIHIDLYRLEEEDLEALGLWEILVGPGVKAVEWSERLSHPIEDAIQLTLRVTGPDRREIEIEAVDSKRKIQKTLVALAALLA